MYLPLLRLNYYSTSLSWIKDEASAMEAVPQLMRLFKQHTQPVKRKLSKCDELILRAIRQGINMSLCALY